MARSASGARRLVTPAGGWWTGAGSMYFDGIDDKVQGVGTPLVGNIAATSAIWLKHARIPVTHELGFCTGTGANGKCLYIGTYAAAIRRFGGGCYGIADPSATGQALLIAGWKRIVVVHSGASGAILVYINGALDVQQAAVVSAFDGAPVIGMTSGGTFLFKGRALDARIYSRAWNAAEVAADFRGEWVSPSGLVRHWPLEEITGGTTRELIGGTSDAVTGAIIDTGDAPFCARHAAGARTEAGTRTAV